MKMTMHIIGMILLRLAIAAIVVGIVMWLWNLVIPGICKYRKKRQIYSVN